MVTLGVALIVAELANRLEWLTGGADGLQGVLPGPVAGLFAFDLFGRTAYFYSLSVLFVLFMIARRIVASPFGLSLRAIKGNVLRANAVGVPVRNRLIAAYTLGAAYAAVAGALLAQTTQFVSLDVLDFHRSADALLIVVFGGLGTLYGALVGAALFKFMYDVLAVRDAAILAVLARPRAGASRAFRARRRDGPACAGWAKIAGATRVNAVPALETRNLVKRFGGLLATGDVTMSLPAGARHALIGPNGAGKTTFVNLLSGALPPTSGSVLLGGRRSRAGRCIARARAGLSRTFQINRLFADFTPLETIALVLSRTAQRRRAMVVAARGEDRSARRSLWRSRQPRSRRGRACIASRRCHMASNACSKSRPPSPSRPNVLLLDEPAAGVPEGERDQILDAVDRLPRDMTIVLIEHDMDLVFRFARTISVLVNGRIFVEGTAAEIASRPSRETSLSRRKFRRDFRGGRHHRKLAWLTRLSSRD